MRIANLGQANAPNKTPIPKNIKVNVQIAHRARSIVMRRYVFIWQS